MSAGIAEVKLAAKIATDLGKPDGLVEVPAGGVAAFLSPLPVARLWGVGHVTEEALRKIGIATIGDLARTPGRRARRGGRRDARARPARARARRRSARGGAGRGGEVDRGGGHLRRGPHREGRRSSESCSRRRRASAGGSGRRRLAGHVITLKVKYADFTLVTRRTTLERATDDDRAILAAARGLLERVDLARPVRLTGISVSGFAVEGERGQLDLFCAAAAPEAALEGKRRALNAALDRLADRFGDGAVVPADLAEAPPRRR